MSPRSPIRILLIDRPDLRRETREWLLRDAGYEVVTAEIFDLRIPPLRERKQDIPLLAEHFLDRLTRTTGAQRTLSQEALKAMIDYDWPGNVRELENCLERACAMSSGPVVQIADLPSPIQQRVQLGAPIVVPDGPKIQPIAELEKSAILTAIDQLKGDKLAAARLLGIGKTTLYRKLKEYAVQE